MVGAHSFGFHQLFYLMIGPAQYLVGRKHPPGLVDRQISLSHMQPRRADDCGYIGVVVKY